MTSRQATVRNGHGIHCRPSAVIAQKAQQFGATVTVCRNSTEANATEILPLIGLALEEGATVEIRAKGVDEEAACDAIAELIETQFDFPPRSCPQDAPPA